ncbi:MAG TPA: hypothetical protein DDX54_07465 [Rhodospirillaceae bacterium]|jgi:hypothetical protein|nr:hypothetical protein [Alphaproteobacteria bacterium]HBH27211.1 hypothetical protein [Rhodospirillaceae bacterium]
MARPPELIVFFNGQIVRADAIRAVERICNRKDGYFTTRIWLAGVDFGMDFECADEEELDDVFAAVSEEIQTALGVRSIFAREEGPEAESPKKESEDE